MDFEIEEVRDIDAAWPELRSLFLGLHDYHEPFLGRRLRDDWEGRWYDYVTAPGERVVFFARNSEDVVGYLNAYVRRDFGLFDELVGFIDDAYVVEDARSRGIGRALLRRVEDWFLSRGIGEVRLNVAAANERGVRFWTQAGFEPQNMTMRKALTKEQR
jgi:GNAT superfamily N-acetyltransferase